MDEGLGRERASELLLVQEGEGRQRDHEPELEELENWHSQQVKGRYMWLVEVQDEAVQWDIWRLVVFCVFLYSQCFVVEENYESHPREDEKREMNKEQKMREHGAGIEAETDAAAADTDTEAAAEEVWIEAPEQRQGQDRAETADIERQQEEGEGDDSALGDISMEHSVPSLLYLYCFVFVCLF